MALRYRSSKDSLFVALVLVLLAQAQNLPEDFHIETLSLGLCEDLLLALVQRLDLVVDVLNALDEGANAITRDSCASVMRAPRCRGRYGRATKVTEKLMEPPKFPLTRGLTLSLALARRRGASPAHGRPHYPPATYLTAEDPDIISCASSSTPTPVR